MTEHQGKRKVSEYTLEFQFQITSGSRCNETALQAVFHQGLSENVLKELACKDQALSLDSLIGLVIHLDCLIRDSGKMTYTERAQYKESQCFDVTEPMQLGRAYLIRAEGEGRRIHGLC